MIINNLNALLLTVQEDKVNVLKGLLEQDQNRNYKTPEVIELLELSFALVQASIVTAMEAELQSRKHADSSMPRYREDSP
jgi:hypothetical protein